MTLRDEGVVKYRCVHRQTPAFEVAQWVALIPVRDQLRQLNLIGVYADGIGFGNLSVRLGDSPQRFVISGTQTGELERTTAEHYSLVTECSLVENRVSCEGPVAASSEALTHFALYELDRKVRAIVHVHNREMWTHYRGRVPTTDAEVPYGTIEMALEMGRLWRESDLQKSRALVMAGHEDGLITFGPSIEEAAERMVELFRTLPPC